MNRIWDNINSNFRYKEYVPFLSENQDTMTLQNLEDAAATVEIPVLGFTKEPPVLREEYDNYALVQFVSLSTWKQIEKTIGNAEPDTYIRILSEKERTLTELSMIETELTNVLGHDISFEVENRIQEKIDNDAMLNGYKLIIGAQMCIRDRDKLLLFRRTYPRSGKNGNRLAYPKECYEAIGWAEKICRPACMTSVSRSVFIAEAPFSIQSYSPMWDTSGISVVKE